MFVENENGTDITTMEQQNVHLQGANEKEKAEKEPHAIKYNKIK